jgi:hypothetical protein
LELLRQGCGRLRQGRLRDTDNHDDQQGTPRESFRHYSSCGGADAAAIRATGARPMTTNNL